MNTPTSSAAGGKRTYWLLVAGGFAILGAGVFVAAECNGAVGVVRDFYSVDVRGLQTAGEMAFQIQEGRRTVVYALTTDDPNQQLTYVDQSRAAGESVAELEGRLGSSRLDAGSRNALQAFSTRWEGYLKIRDVIIAAILLGEGKKGLAVDLQQAHPAFEQVKAALTRLLAELDRSAGERLAYVTRSLYRTMGEVAVLLIGMLFFLRNVGANLERRRTVSTLQKINGELEITQRNLRDQELRLRTLFDNVIDGIITSNEKGIIESANRAAEKIFGYPVSELVGNNLSILMTSPYSELHDGFLAEYRDSESKKVIGVSREVTGRRKDGTHFPMDLAVSELHTDGRRTFVGIVRDITDRRKAEEDLQKSRRQLMDVTANIPGAVFQTERVGLDGRRFLFVSEGIESLHGVTAQELMENPDLVLKGIYPDDVPEVARELSHALRQGIPYKFTYRVEKNGEIRWLTASAVPQQQSSGELFWNGVVIDVTSAKEAEGKLNAYAEQLAAAVGKAEAATKAKSEFLATMSHEIRTPMNGVIGMTGLLIETHLSSEQRDYAETIRSSGEALLTIINDILEFSKIEAGKLDLEWRVFDLRSVVEESLEVVAPTAHRKALELCAPLDDSIPLGLIGDPARLRQILLNLLSNAVKFTESGEVVLMVTREEGASEDPVRVRFEVRDTGIGISEAAQSRLFQSFSQADSSTTRRFGGTGLGLAICKRLVELMGGEIGLQSTAGVGSVFWFTIPFKTTTESISIPATVEYLRNRRILAVDDNGTNRSILKQQLGKIGMIVTCAAGGREALEELRLAVQVGRPFELAILDLHMPVMNGLMLARDIRREKAIGSIPLMMLTSDRDRDEAATARELGVKMFLVKPVRQANLIRAVGEMFGAASHEHHPSAPADYDTLHARILVAEDNTTNQRVIVLRLEKFGCTVHVAQNGYEAVRAVEANSFDAILMDCQMPLLDGFQATAQIRQKSSRHIPIIALTANAMDGERERCLAAGMDDYLSKPVRSEELLKKLQHWIGVKPEADVAAASREETEPPASLRSALDQFIAGMEDEGIERDDVNALFDSFLETSAALMEQLQESVKKEDSRLLARTAHTLKGTFATFGLKSLTNLAAALETAGNGQHWDGVEANLQVALTAYGEARELVTEKVGISAE
jgi:two-component system sensor histidine kinase/response regulator